MADASTAVATSRRMADPTPELVAAAYDAIIEGKAPPVIGDPDATMYRILTEIREATTPEQVFQAQTLPSWQEAFLDEPVIVHSISLNPSTFDDSTSSVYAVVELSNPETGEATTVSVGGQKVLVQLVKAYELQWFPIKVRLTAKETGNAGRQVLGLEYAGKKA